MLMALVTVEQENSRAGVERAFGVHAEFPVELDRFLEVRDDQVYVVDAEEFHGERGMRRVSVEAS